TSSANPVVAGQAVTFTATVSALTPGLGVPGGTVTFMDGNVILDTEAVGSGTVTFTTSFAAAGGHVITAVYSGNFTFQASTSQPLTEQVNPPTTQATTTAIGSSALFAVFGQPVTLRASVTAAAGTPTGTVTFRDGNTVLGTAQVNAAGQVALT